MPVVSPSYFIVNEGRTVTATEYSVESTQVERETFDGSHREEISPKGNGIHRQAGARAAAH